MSTNPVPSVFKSRWGFHPIDYRTFLELKRLHKLMLKDL